DPDHDDNVPKHYARYDNYHARYPYAWYSYTSHTFSHHPPQPRVPLKGLQEKGSEDREPRKFQRKQIQIGTLRHPLRTPFYERPHPLRYPPRPSHVRWQFHGRACIFLVLRTSSRC